MHLMPDTNQALRTEEKLRVVKKSCTSGEMKLVRHVLSTTSTFFCPPWKSMEVRDEGNANQNACY
jgi:hypothetical protein